MGAFGALFDMIKLELEPQTAVALIGVVERETNLYTNDPLCCPNNIIALRALLLEIDRQLEANVNQTKEDMTEEALAMYHSQEGRYEDVQ